MPAPFAVQKGRFATDATEPSKWRIDHLGHPERTITKNQDVHGAALGAGFKAAIWDLEVKSGVCIGEIAEAKLKLRDWTRPTEVELLALFPSKGYQARAFRAPYGVTLLLFTGSVPVGKIVIRASAAYLTPIIFELGGQNRPSSTRP